MFLHSRELLRSQVAASGLSVATVARQAQVREGLLAALLSGEEVTCSLGPARRLEWYLRLPAGELFAADVARNAAEIRDLARKAVD